MRLESEGWSYGHFKLIHDAASDRDDAAACADYLLNLGVHHYGQVLHLEPEAPISFRKNFESRSDAKSEPGGAGRGSRHASRPQA